MCNHKSYKLRQQIMPVNSVISFYQIIILAFLLLFNSIVTAIGVQWDHSIDLDESFRLMWIIRDQDITFEVRVRTLGYVGLGFTRDGTIYGADVAVGWIDHGHAYFQDRHIKKHSDDGEPIVDPSQDYILLLGYENATHTVLRFKRKLDTCDMTHDVQITNDTTRIIFMYSNDEPKRGSVAPGSLPKPAEALKTSRSLYFGQRVIQDPSKYDSKTKVIELRNVDVELPQDGESLHWCKMFKLTDISKKHHLIHYEPVFETTANIPYLNDIVLHECQGSTPELEIMSRENGRPCYESDNPLMTCNAIVGAWSRGSEGFTFPEEAGYPMDSSQARYFLLVTHYHDRNFDYIFDQTKQMADNSGLRLYMTPTLRKHDAGVLSVGVDPSWRHLIPPGQEKVVSEGHCVEECTRRAFPRQGINIFAVMMRTHEIGRKIKLRQVRGREELLPIAEDSNIDINYLEYRRLKSAVNALPGDRLIAECTYDSSSREAITLGGTSAREETCLVLTLYYPRRKELTTCHSLPSLPTVLHSLGIDELSGGSNPVSIASPPDLAGMSLETRLITYDWVNSFNIFQSVTKKGSFKSLCWSAKNTPMPGTESIDSYSPNITKTWSQPSTCSLKNTLNHHNRNRYVTESDTNAAPGLTFTEEENEESNNIIEGAARSKVSRSSATESMSLSGVSSFNFSRKTMKNNMIFLFLIIFIHSFRIS